MVREGLETALFLFSASNTASPAATTAGGLLGLAVAIGIGRLLYQGSRRVDLALMFKVTGVLLILFAAGLLAHGLHEFQEAGYVDVLVDEVWNTNGILDEKGTAGSLLKGLLATTATLAAGGTGLSDLPRAGPGLLRKTLQTRYGRSQPTRRGGGLALFAAHEAVPLFTVAMAA